MNMAIERKQSPAVEEQQKPRSKWSIYALFIGNMVSFVGDMLTLLAIPWFVLQTTGSVVQAGITGFCSALPMVLSGFFGSTLVDRLGYKRTSVLGDLLSGLTVMCIPLLYHTVGLAFWQLLIFVFIGGLLRSPADTARSAMVPELAPLAGMRLERANALGDGAMRISRFFGAPLAGVLIVLIGTSNLLWLDAASFVFSALMVGLFVPAIVISDKETGGQAQNSGYFAELWDGIRYVRKDVVIFTIIVVVMITNMLDNANFSVVSPAYMLLVFHQLLPYSILIATTGGMAFVGTVIFGLIGHHFPRRLTLGICFTLGGALRFWALLFPFFPFLVGFYAVSGLAIGPINSLLSTVTQERIPPAMRARVFGLLGAGVTAGIPLGTFVSGFVVNWLGLRATLFIMGVIYLAATLSILINPKLKRMERAPMESA